MSLIFIKTKSVQEDFIQSFQSKVSTMVFLC